MIRVKMRRERSNQGFVSSVGHLLSKLNGLWHSEWQVDYGGGFGPDDQRRDHVQRWTRVEEMLGTEFWMTRSTYSASRQKRRKKDVPEHPENV